MTKEQLQKATAIKKEIDFINRSLIELDECPRTTFQTSPSGKSFNYVPAVMRGFFDEDVYRLRVSAHIAELEKQLADI